MAIDTVLLNERMTAIEVALNDVRIVVNTLRDIAMVVVGVLEELASQDGQDEIDGLAERAQVILDQLTSSKETINEVNGTLQTEVIAVDPTP